MKVISVFLEIISVKYYGHQIFRLCVRSELLEVYHAVLENTAAHILKLCYKLQNGYCIMIFEYVIALNV